MPKFITSQLKVAFFDQLQGKKDSEEADANSKEVLEKAVHHAFERSKERSTSTKMVVFLAGDFFLTRETVHTLAKIGLQRGARLLETMDDLLVFFTMEANVVTVRFVGGSRFPANGKRVALQSDSDDSDATECFEAEKIAFVKREAAKKEEAAKREVERKNKLREISLANARAKKPKPKDNGNDSDGSDYDNWAFTNYSQQLA
jgi:hypothetical protein